MQIKCQIKKGEIIQIKVKIIELIGKKSSDK